MFSLDFSLFYDNLVVVFFIYLYYILFQKYILPYLVLMFKWKVIIDIVIYKELFLYNYLNRSIIYFRFFDSLNFLNNKFFLSSCKPSILNYSYIKKSN